ncbi:MAG: hypothetical protein ACTHNS_06560 [Marmoricola sp.]
MPPSSPVQDFGLAPALRARLMGVALLGLGALLVVVTIVVFLAELPVGVLTAFVVLVVIGVFVLGGALVRRWYVVRLDEVGYQVRFVRGAGVRSARWDDVLDATTASVAGARCLVLRLRDGRSTTIPVDLVEGDSEEFVREVGRRLAPGRR